MLYSSAQKKQLPDYHQVTSLFSTVISLGRYKTGDPVGLHNSQTEVEDVEVVVKHMGDAPYVNLISQPHGEIRAGVRDLCFLQTPTLLPTEGGFPAGLSAEPRWATRLSLLETTTDGG